MDLDAEPIERTLGLVWDFQRDAFVLGAKVEADGKTKRDIMKSNLVSCNATKHIVGNNINMTKHYVGSMVRFDTLFFFAISKVFCSFKAPILFVMGS